MTDDTHEVQGEAEPLNWACTTCGYRVEGELPEKCPDCGADEEMFDGGCRNRGCRHQASAGTGPGVTASAKTTRFAELLPSRVRGGAAARTGPYLKPVA